MILSFWSIGYLAITVVAAVLAFFVLEGDAATKALGFFIASLLVFLVSIPMSKKK